LPGYDFNILLNVQTSSNIITVEIDIIHADGNCVKQLVIKVVTKYNNLYISLFL